MRSRAVLRTKRAQKVSSRFLQESFLGCIESAECGFTLHFFFAFVFLTCLKIIKRWGNAVCVRFAKDFQVKGIAMEKLFYYRHTTSTNKVAFSLATRGFKEGTAVIAESQEEGRGRLGKVWQSPPGKGLYCSLIVRPQLTVEDYPKITLTAGVSVAKILEEIAGKRMLLKWPNDVYSEGKKCCGILTESSPLTEKEENLFAVVGIGININSVQADFPEELRDNVTSLNILTGRQYDILDIFKKIHQTFLVMLTILQDKGFPEILTEWKKRDMLVGKRLQWLTNSGQVVYGISEGPDSMGRLLVKDDQGNHHNVLSGDVRLAETMRRNLHW